eukprot:5457549-Pyramimonas_sp.AAC.1
MQSTFLIAADSYLGKVGLGANKFYTEMVEALHDRKAAGEDLASPGPTFLTVFFMTTRALRKVAPTEIKHVNSLIRHFT